MKQTHGTTRKLLSVGLQSTYVVSTLYVTHAALHSHVPARDVKSGGREEKCLPSSISALKCFQMPTTLQFAHGETARQAAAAIAPGSSAKMHGHPLGPAREVQKQRENAPAGASDLPGAGANLRH